MCTDGDIVSVVDRFLVLFRHMSWLIDKRVPPNRGVRGKDGYVHEHTVVMDGTMVCLANRHAYLSGRAHCTVPAGSPTRKQTSPFKDRLMIPDRHHRAAVASLLQCAHSNTGVLCNDACLSLISWLRDDSSDQDGRPFGGYFLAPYIQIEITDNKGRRTTVPRVGLTTLRLARSCAQRYAPAMRHWSSNTPEIQVLPWPLALAVKSWLQRDSMVPPDGLDTVVQHSEHVQSLMMADADTHGQTRHGEFWQLSDDLTELLTQMVMVVSDTSQEHVEDVKPREGGGQEEAEEACTYQPPAHRQAPTEFEMFLWVRDPTRCMLATHQQRCACKSNI